MYSSKIESEIDNLRHLSILWKYIYFWRHEQRYTTISKYMLMIILDYNGIENDKEYTFHEDAGSHIGRYKSKARVFVFA